MSRAWATTGLARLEPAAAVCFAPPYAIILIAGPGVAVAVVVALPLESVTAEGGLNEPPLPPSLKLTVAPTSGWPLYGLAALIRIGAGSALKTVAVWVLPPVILTR